MGSQDWSVVDLSNRQLTTISDDDLKNAEQVVDLDLSESPDSKVFDWLCKFKRVKSLRLKGCELRRVPEQIFDLRQLEKLFLQKNYQLRVTTSIGKLRSLKELNLENCKLRDLPEELWDLTHLEKLSLAQNETLNGVSPSMQKLKCLKDFDIERCYLLDLPEELWNLSRLEKLNVTGNFLLRDLSSSIHKLQSLTEFSCGSPNGFENEWRKKSVTSKLANQIRRDSTFHGGYEYLDEKGYFHFGLRILPEALWNLQRLEKLYLGGNKNLQFNNSTIGKLKKLKTLTISGFGIESLPDDLSDLHDLEVLTLNNNKQLQRLCSSFGRLKSLKELHITECRIKSLPESFANLDRLEKLDIDCNAMEDVNLFFGQCKTLRELRELSISDCEVLSLPDTVGDLHNLHILTVRNCARLQELGSSFGKLNTLEILHLHSNDGLKSLCSSFGKLSSLQQLSITDCNIKSLPESFRTLNNLEILKLSSPEQSESLCSSLGDLSSLRQLRIACLELKSLPESFGNLGKLEILELYSFKQPESLCSSFMDFSSLQQLRQLIINDSPIKSLPESFGKLCNLKVLHLDCNKQLESLCSSFGDLSSLEKLRITVCEKLKSLPQSFRKLCNLEILIMNGNDQLESLCSSFGDLFSLKQLRVNRCIIRNLPESFGKLRKLEILNLDDMRQLESISSLCGDLLSPSELTISGSQITSLPESFTKLQKLKVLKLISNKQLESLCSSFGDLSSLKELHITSSQINSLPESFGALDNLEFLFLEKNEKMESLCLSFGDLSSLKELSITGCQIKSLPESFGKLHKLEVLKLEYNKQMESLCSSFGDLSSLKELVITRCGIKILPESFGELHNAQVKIRWKVFKMLLCCPDLLLRHENRKKKQGLEILYLDNNKQLESLCSSFGDLSSLKELRITGSQIKSLPESFRKLYKLEILQLDNNNQMESLCVSFEDLSSLKELRITGCLIKSLPESLGKLPNLEVLKLENIKQLESLCSSFSDFSSLEVLIITGCQIKSLPESFGTLNKLEKLFLDNNNQLKSLCASFGDLSSLRELYISFCQIKSLPASFVKLNKLEVLELISNEQLESLCSSFGDLSSLKVLRITHCQINSLPESFGALHNLEFLFLGKNKKMESLCFSFGDLSSLKKLSITGCQIKSLPESFVKLHKLEELFLDNNNQLESLCASFGDLSSLRVLYIFACQIKSLPASFVKLNKLERLRLCDSGLHEYPECTIQLINLRLLDLSNKKKMETGNSIKKLPAALKKSKLEKLILNGNPITEPPESIWMQGIDAIRSYMNAGSTSGFESFLADCINMLGETGAGKTSITLSLQSRVPTLCPIEDRTQVMDTVKVKIDNGPTVCVNDFGGHPIYHSVIPIFLPSGGLSIVAFDLEKSLAELKDEVEQWVLTAIAKSSQKNRIVVTGTRSDLILHDQLTLLKDKMNFLLENIVAKLNQPSFTMSKPTIARPELMTVSCKECYEDFEKFCEFVFKSLNKPELIPSRWLEVMDKILNFNNSARLWISISDAEQIYRACIGDDRECERNVRIILKYLVNSSLIVWLENHELLNDKVFNSPQKIVDLCKNVFYHDLKVQPSEVCDKNDIDDYRNGILTRTMLTNLLNKNDVDPLVELLEHFDLLCEIPTPGREESRNKRFAMAGKLPEELPKRLSDSEDKIQRSNTSVWLHLSFHGSIVPVSFFETSLLMIMSNFRKDLGIHPEIALWRDGLLLIHDMVHLVMKRLSEQHRACKISLSVGSMKKHRSPWEVLSRVVKLLHDKVLQSWPGLSPKWEIYCPACKRHTISSTGKEIHYKELISDKDKFLSNDKNGRIDGTSNFKECVHDVPRILLTPVFKDYTIEQQDRITDFFNNKEFQMQHGATRINDDIASTLPRIWHKMDDNQLQKRFQTLCHEMSTTMNLQQVRDASLKMYSLGRIQKGDYEAVLSKEGATEAARTLIVDVIDKRKERELYCAFLDYVVSSGRTNFERAFTEIQNKVLGQ